ncbi:MAG TPA: hypothetical protein VN811_06530 [Thermoanaerobaculia bacterium]|nr:hypothetical protein [Thermoanaerobaculia bacterium]HXT50680.1 hypothetical protein [Thermoanaerobaculia bacterium]
MVEYEFTLADGRVHRFVVGGEDERPATAELPSWTALTFHQCGNCPYSTADTRRCPAATDVFRIAERFADQLSYDRVHVRVQRGDRSYEMDCDVQTGLGSLLGLAMASSGCPILGQLRGLARFHLPFAEFEETLFRTVGLYLLRQYFISKDGGIPDFELVGLAQLYDDLQEVNRAFKRRIEAISPRDASINAVTLLFSLSALVAMQLDSGLEQLRQLTRTPADVVRA